MPNEDLKTHPIGSELKTHLGGRLTDKQIRSYLKARGNALAAVAMGESSPQARATSEIAFAVQRLMADLRGEHESQSLLADLHPKFGQPNPAAVYSKTEQPSSYQNAQTEAASLVRLALRIEQNELIPRSHLEGLSHGRHSLSAINEIGLFNQERARQMKREGITGKTTNLEPKRPYPPQNKFVRRTESREALKRKEKLRAKQPPFYHQALKKLGLKLPRRRSR